MTAFAALSMHQAAASTPLQAYEAGNLGLSFGGAGYLILWYAGVLTVFEQLGITAASGGRAPAAARRAAGSSSGALTSAAVCSGTPAAQFHEAVANLTNGCYKAPLTCAGSMDTTLRGTLAKMLPPDAAQRCNNTGFVALTVYDAPGAPKPALAGTFDSRNDLISSLAASSYVPMWSGAALLTGWRGKNAMDGGVTARQPCPPGVGYCVRIASRSPDMDGQPGVPDTRGNLGGVVAQIQRALGGARASAAAVKKPALPPVGAAKADPKKLEALRAAGLDLAPGLAGGNPFDAATWSEMSTLPCDPETCDFVYKMGQLDAMAWADATGIKAAAAKRNAGAAGAAKAPRRRLLWL